MLWDLEGVVINKKLFPCQSGTSKHIITGSIASFKTNMESALENVIITVPYSADNLFNSLAVVQTGANLWGETWEIGSLTASGTDYPSTARIRSVGYTEIKDDETYYIFSSGETADIHFYDKNKDHLSYVQKTDTTFTTPTGTKYIRFCMSVAYGTTYQNDISINYPSTDTSYHAHVTPTTHTLDLGQTCYGGAFKVLGGIGTAYDSEGVSGPITFTPIEDIITLNGINNVWCDVENSTVKLTYLTSSGTVCNKPLQFLPLFYNKERRSS